VSPEVPAFEAPVRLVCESSELAVCGSPELSFFESSELPERDAAESCVVVTTPGRRLAESEPPLSSLPLRLGAVEVVTVPVVTVVLGRAVSWADSAVEVVDEVSPSPTDVTREDSSVASPPSMILGTDLTIAVAGSVG